MPIPTADPAENTKIASTSLKRVLLAPANSNPKQNPTTNLWEATAPTNKNTCNQRLYKNYIPHKCTDILDLSPYRIIHITFTLFGSITHFGRSLLQANRQSFENSMDRKRQ